MTYLTTTDIRRQLVEIYLDNPFQSMVEIKAASFVADKPAIIGEPNQAYIKRELEWFESQSLSIHNFPGGHAPAMWKCAADSDGNVNSNYGWVLWSSENGGENLDLTDDMRSQFDFIVTELRRDYASRRALCIYTRPSMHVDQKLNGDGQDFMCTNAVQYSITPDGRLDVIVQMRSNDVVFGYRNDYAWQAYAAGYVLAELQIDWPSLELGTIYWQAQSLHVYPRHFWMLRNEATRKRSGQVVDDGVGRNIGDYLIADGDAT